jgi:hypothetical protein
MRTLTSQPAPSNLFGEETSDQNDVEEKNLE